MQCIILHQMQEILNEYSSVCVWAGFVGEGSRVNRLKASMDGLRAVKWACVQGCACAWGKLRAVK